MMPPCVGYILENGLRPVECDYSEDIIEFGGNEYEDEDFCYGEELGKIDANFVDLENCLRQVDILMKDCSY